MNFKTILVRLGVIYAAELALWEVCTWSGHGLSDSAAEIMVVIPAVLSLAEFARMLFVRDQKHHEELVRRLDAEEGRSPHA